MSIENSVGLVSIKKRSQSEPTKSETTTPITLIDKFILVAISGSALGILWLGTMLWLMRIGIITPTESYYNIRYLHASIQLYVLFSTAICGFIIQAAPRILGINRLLSLKSAIWVMVAPVVGTCILIIHRDSLAPYIIITSSPLTTLVLLMVRQKSKILRPQSLFLSVSLVAFTIGIWSDIGDPRTAFLICWAGVGGAMFGVSHIFAANLLLARYPSTKTIYTCLILFCSSCCLFILRQDQLAFFTSLLVLLTYSYKIQIFKKLSGSLLLRWGYRYGYLWAIIALITLVVEPLAFDNALHILATGWGMSILFALSLHITNVLAQTSYSLGYPPFLILTLWQIVPVVRGGFFVFENTLLISTTLISISAIFIGYWLTSIIRASLAIQRRALRI